MQFLFLVKDQEKANFEFSNWNHKKRFFDQAKGKAEVVITSWNNLIAKKNHVFAERGIVWDLDGSEREIKKAFKISPDYINEHVTLENNKSFKVNQSNYKVFCELIKQGIIESNELGLKSLTRKYINFLKENYWPDSKVSYNRDIIYLGKWYLEKCFMNAESGGLFVSRPKTFLIQKREIESVVPKLLQSEQVIISKPHSATRSDGIHMITKENYLQKLEKIKAEPHNFLILQKFIENSFLYEGCKADLRIYVGVHNWNPLKFRVYRNGLTRISNKNFDMGELGDEENSITTFSLLKTGTMLHNVTIDEYFSTIAEDSDSIWKKIEIEAGKALEAIVQTKEHVNESDLKNVVYLLGFDFLLEKDSDGMVKPVILEINHFPTLYRSEKYDPENKSNERLDQSYQQFFEDVAGRVI